MATSGDPARHAAIADEMNPLAQSERRTERAAIIDQIGGGVGGTRSLDDLLDDTLLLYETSLRMGTALDVEEVVRAYLKQVAIRGRYRCAVTLRDGGAENADLIVYGRWSPEEGIRLLHEWVGTSRDEYDADLDAGRTVMVADFRTDPRVSAEFRSRHIARGTLPALAMIPLIVGGRRIGLVVLSRATVEEWQERDLHPYQITAALLAAGVESRRQQLRAAARERQLAVLEERQHLARELHDSVTQSVFSATLIGETLAEGRGHDPAERAHRMERMLTLCRSALRELRTLVAQLRPSAEGDAPAPLDAIAVGELMRVRQEGLAGALSQYAADRVGGDPRVAVDAAGYVAQAIEHEHTLFRIAQEALNNALKYARAHTVTITLLTDEAWTHLVVADDGAGFTMPPPEVARAAGTLSGGHGLSIMRERAEGSGGTLDMTSAPGAGTVVEARLPRKDRRG